jgi:predicted DCC family thiol-disulfide oxidoreductase YuxK
MFVSFHKTAGAALGLIDDGLAVRMDYGRWVQCYSSWGVNARDEIRVGSSTILQPPDSGSPRRHLLLYDGVCGLCNRVVRFVLRRDRREVFDFASLQSEAGRALLATMGRDTEPLETVYIAPDYLTGSPRILDKSRAALFVLSALGGPWRLLTVFGVLPAALLDVLYDIVARHRYAVFGRYESCPLPAPEHRRRFIDRENASDEQEDTVPF